jgi:hypothetical protein
MGIVAISTVLAFLLWLGHKMEQNQLKNYKKNTAKNSINGGSSSSKT